MMHHKLYFLVLLIYYCLIAKLNGELIIERVCFLKFICVPLPHYYFFDVADSVSLRFITGCTSDVYERVPLSESYKIVLHPKFDPMKVTILYIHGWTESYEVESVQTIMNAFLIRGDHNLVVVDSRKASGVGNYLTSLKTIPTVTIAVAKAFETMVQAGMNLSLTHMIGHSLGGIAAGYVGGYMGGRLHRITALDPATSVISLGRSLQRNDAEVVDVIHTDAGVWGDTMSGYTTDFYPNGGRAFQPGCLDKPLYCSHHSSWKFYAESIIFPKAFPAVKCDSWKSFQQGNCSNETQYMGYHYNNRESGKYFLRTKGTFPYGYGQHTYRWISGYALSVLKRTWNEII